MIIGFEKSAVGYLPARQGQKLNARQAVLPPSKSVYCFSVFRSHPECGKTLFIKSPLVPIFEKAVFGTSSAFATTGYSQAKRP